MISDIDVIRAISTLIETTFPTYPVNDNDLEEGFPRPSYFLDVVDIKSEYWTVGYVKETDSFELFFFAEDIYKGFLDLLEVKDTLLQIFNNPLPVTDLDTDEVLGHISFTECTVDVSKADKALRCQLKSELIQALPDPDENLPYAGELVFNENFVNKE